MDKRTYFDWNASAPLRDEARIAMVNALELTGNASSVHAEGRAVRRLVEEARSRVANLVGAEAKHVIFTSGATEANVMALTPALEFGGRRSLRDRLFVSAVEHPSVRSGGRFAAEDIEYLPVNDDGVVDLPVIARALERAERPLARRSRPSSRRGSSRSKPQPRASGRSARISTPSGLCTRS